MLRDFLFIHRTVDSDSGCLEATDSNMSETIVKNYSNMSETIVKNYSNTSETIVFDQCLPFTPTRKNTCLDVSLWQDIRQEAMSVSRDVSIQYMTYTFR